jgi:hypothetical protein
LAAGKISLAPERSGDISALMYELTNSVIEMSGNTSHFGPTSEIYFQRLVGVVGATGLTNC